MCGMIADYSADPAQRHGIRNLVELVEQRATARGFKDDKEPAVSEPPLPGVPVGPSGRDPRRRQLHGSCPWGRASAVPHSSSPRGPGRAVTRSGAAP